MKGKKIKRHSWKAVCVSDLEENIRIENEKRSKKSLAVGKAGAEETDRVE